MGPHRFPEEGDTAEFTGAPGEGHLPPLPKMRRQNKQGEPVPEAAAGPSRLLPAFCSASES